MAPFALSGRWQYRLGNLLLLLGSSLGVALRRLLRGPLLPGWPAWLETANHYLRWQSRVASHMKPVEAGREFQDALVFRSPALARVRREAASGPVRGEWYQPENQSGPVTILYLHGGGYAYYAKAHENLIALVALAARARTFALDYRLIPEHPFPAQLEDALAAYCWLVDNGISPEKLVVAGDSAGGNLTLALLLALRERRMPLPALAVCLAPWTDVENHGASMISNEKYDWVDHFMTEKWAGWLCSAQDPRNPLISPIHADLRGLPPIYIQAGEAEILYDMICAFAEKARSQGADVILEVWKHMNHDFQAYGDELPESKAALARIGQVVAESFAKER